MARETAPGKRNVKSSAKVKTGCTTCRIRKVKCDEAKPSCQRCVSTGRTCDGYELNMKIIISATPGTVHQTVSNSRPDGIDPRDIGLLNHYFSTKTLRGVNVACDEEAREVLKASLTDPSVRHAITSLKALRQNLETSGDCPTSALQLTPSHRYGLEQYSTALVGLASTLSNPNANGLKSALLCCQIFISIEQVRKDYASMGKHIIQGLTIMHQNRARPAFVKPAELLPAHPEQIPLLDVFIIKLFAAPCKFAEPAAKSGTNDTTLSAGDARRDDCDIAPNLSRELKSLAGSILIFLDQVSQVQSVDTALRLLQEKKRLLDSLQSWLNNSNRIQTVSGDLHPQSITSSFLRLFHVILKTVVLGTLDCSLATAVELKAENDRLQDMANDVGERVKNYMMCFGTNSLERQPITR